MIFHTSSRGFTLIELLVSVGIFTFMTVLLVAKYGNFNQSVLLTNLAYDVALTLRTAQTYGLSIKGSGTSFQNAYGIHFSTTGNKAVILYASLNDLAFDAGEVISTYNIKYGAIVSSICKGTGPTNCTTNVPILDVAFKRPDPEAFICGGADVGGGELMPCQVLNPPTADTTYATYAEVTLSSSDGNTRRVSIRDNGQISVVD